MDINTDILIRLVPGLGMILVAAVAALYWRRVSRLQLRWFWAGAGLWTIAVALKIVCALLTNVPVHEFMKENLSYPLLVAGEGLFIGIQSSVFEMGLTLAAVLIWGQLGRDAKRAIGIGVGAGAFEAFLLGLAGLAAMIAVMAGVRGTEKIREGMDAMAATTPFFWLLAPVERIIAILCHTSSRALILLGAVKKKPMMIFWGFLIFTLLDGVAGAAHVSGKLGAISTWWIELAILPLAVVSIPIIRSCYAQWGEVGTLESLQTTQKRSRKVALLTGVIVVCLIALLGYGHVVMMSQQDELKFRSNYVVSEGDEWTVVSSEEIRVCSTLIIKKFPETYEDLIVQLPFQEATVQKVRLEDKDLPFSRPEPEEYHIDLSSHQDTAQSGTITVLWTFSPTACLTPSEMGRYSTPLRSLVPSDSFSLTVTIADGSGFQFSFGDSEVRSLRAFNSPYDRPKMEYGNWSGLIKKEDNDTGGAQQGAPADADKPHR